MGSILNSIISSEGKKLAVLIDPDKFEVEGAAKFLMKLPKSVTHIFVGGSSVEAYKTEITVHAIKAKTQLPILLFPGDHSQITDAADGILFLSLISGRNPEFLIEQHIKAVPKLRGSSLEIIPTGYVLIDGGRECAVQKVSGTKPIPQEEIKTIADTALAGQFLGQQLIYLEAGSGAKFPVSKNIVSEVKKAIKIPLLVGGGIRTKAQLKRVYNAGADMVVIGTAFENGGF